MVYGEEHKGNPLVKILVSKEGDSLANGRDVLRDVKKSRINKVEETEG